MEAASAGTNTPGLPAAAGPAPLVSVTICTYNGAAYLRKTIDSVLAQTYANLEIVIVDDGSTDNTREVLEEAAKCDPRIKVFFQKNAGLPSARNAAFERASGEWIAIIDQDDLCYPTRIERQLACSRANPSADLIFCDTEYIDEHDKVIGRHLEKFPLPGTFLPRKDAANLLLQMGCFVDSESFFMKKAAIARVGALVTTMSYVCDYEYFVRAGFVCDFAYTPEKLAAWRIHSSQATKTSKKQFSELVTVLKMYRRHKDLTWKTRLIVLYKIAKYTIRNLWVR